MKVVTSIGIFNDAVGTRMSITCSEIDDQAGTIIADNKRIDRVVTDAEMLSKIADLKAYAQEFIAEG